MTRLTDALRRAGVQPTSDQATPDPNAAASVQTDAPWDAYPAAGDPGGPADDAPPFVSEADLDQPAPTLQLGDPALLSRLVIGSTIPPEAVEQYRRLGGWLHFIQQERGIKTLMVASALAGEGKTLTAVNLALTLSESFRRRVLLVDGDLRRPNVTKLFQSQGNPEAEFSFTRVLPRLTVLSAGRPAADPISKLTSPRLRQLIAERSSGMDWVIVDTPPVALLPDAALIRDISDGTVLVVGAGQTPFKAIQQVLDALGRDHVLGVVLSRVDPRAATNGYDYSDMFKNYLGGSTGAGTSSSTGSELLKNVAMRVQTTVPSITSSGTAAVGRVLAAGGRAIAGAAAAVGRGAGAVVAGGSRLGRATIDAIGATTVATGRGLSHGAKSVARAAGATVDAIGATTAATGQGLSHGAKSVARAAGRSADLGRAAASSAREASTRITPAVRSASASVAAAARRSEAAAGGLVASVTRMWNGARQGVARSATRSDEAASAALARVGDRALDAWAKVEAGTLGAVSAMRRRLPQISGLAARLGFGSKASGDAALRERPRV